MILKRLGLAFVLGAASLVSCQTLPDTGTCGNGLVEVERGEDCDGATTRPGSVCNASCHFSCAVASGASTASPCPGGYFCGGDGTCRSPSGNFAQLGSSLSSDAYRVDVADVDGDGFKDLIATSPGVTRVLFFNGTTFGEAAELPNSGLLPPIVASLTTDALNDLLFPTGQIAVWQGRADRTLDPAQYPSLLVGGVGQGLRLVFADTHAAIGGKPSPGDETYLFVPKAPGATQPPDIELQRGGEVTPIQALRARAEDLVGEVQVGDLDGDACPEMLYAFGRGTVGAGAPGVDVFFPCRAIAGGTLPIGGAPSAAPPPAIRFPGVPGRPTDRYVVGAKGILLTDLDGDGRLDVLVHTEIDTAIANDRSPSIFVSYGVGDGQFQSTSPVDHPVTNDGLATKLDDALRLELGPTDQDVFPLAAGQLTKVGSSPDMLCDFVLPDGILLRVPGVGGTAQDVRILSPVNAPWQDAKIGDFNSDGFVDVVAGGAGNLDFYAGTTQPLVMTPFSRSVLNGAKNLTAADFDGDQATDIAFSSGTDVLVAFGSPRGGPKAPVSMGHFPSIEHISAGSLPVGPNSLPDGLADIAVVGTDTGQSNAQFLSMLAGSVDRRLVSPLQLRVEGSHERVVASMTAAVGAFNTTDKHPDVAALGEPLREGDAFTLWNIPLTADARVITNDVTQGGFNLDALGAATGKPQWTEAVAAALDLDPESDGALDELVVAVPPAFEADGEENDMTRAGLLTVARLADGKWSPESSTAFGGGPQSMTLGVSAPSLSSSRFLWKLRAADVDGDGAKDLVALFSVGKTQTEGPRPRLQVYFNDRNGKLGDPLLVDVPGEDIFDCAWIYADEKSTDTDNKKDLVVLTRPAGDPTGRLAVFVLTANKATRSFSPPKAVGDLSGKVAGGAANGFRTSIAAGDVDADGVDDILVATGSQLLVFKGTPR